MTAFIVLSAVLAIAATALGWLFVLDYSREPWEETEAGKHIMRFTAGLAVAMTWILVGFALRLVFGLPDWLELILAAGRSIIFGWLAVMLWSRWRLLRANRRERQKREPSGLSEEKGRAAP